MNNVFKHTTKEGLKCIYIKREGFKGQYAGIGVHYGSAHKKFIQNGEIIETKTGIAHFLEHKAFVMPNGKDALELFDAMNCEANAYTTREQTIYYFQTVDTLEPPLALLLEMFFTPGFTEENIESEKSIIVSELEDSLDRVDARIYNECLKSLYPKDSYSDEILGEKEDIESMTLSDLKQVYDAFYTPENALFVVVADKVPEELFAFIDSVMSRLSLHHSDAKTVPFIESLHPLEPRVIYEDIPYPELHIMGRIKGYTYETPILTNQFIALMDCVYSVEADFYKYLADEGLLVNDDIQYSFATHEYGMYYHFEVYTEDPYRTLVEMVEKIRNLSENDFKEEIAKNELKAYLCDYIRALDSISYVGDETLSLGLEGSDYFEEYQHLINTKMEDILKQISKIRDSELTYLIAMPKNAQNEL